MIIVVKDWQVVYPVIEGEILEPEDLKTYHALRYWDKYNSIVTCCNYNTKERDSISKQWVTQYPLRKLFLLLQQTMEEYPNTFKPETIDWMKNTHHGTFYFDTDELWDSLQQLMRERIQRNQEWMWEKEREEMEERKRQLAQWREERSRSQER